MTTSTITPRDERESALIAKHQHDSHNSDAAIVGPLIRRSTDGKLVRLPNIGFASEYAPQVALDAYMLGQGPGSSQPVAMFYAEIAREYRNWSPSQRADAAAAALRNRANLLSSVRTNPPAPEIAHHFARVFRAIPAWAKVNRFTGPAPAAPVRT